MSYERSRGLLQQWRMNRKIVDKETKIMLEKIDRYSKHHNVEVYEKLPPYYRVLYGATTAPVGSIWISNGKGRFSNERRKALLLESWLLNKICSYEKCPECGKEIEGCCIQWEYQQEGAETCI